MSLDPPSAFRRLGSANSESLVDDRSDCLRPIHQVLLGILIEAGGPGFVAIIWMRIVSDFSSSLGRDKSVWSFRSTGGNIHRFGEGALST